MTLIFFTSLLSTHFPSAGLSATHFQAGNFPFTDLAVGCGGCVGGGAIIPEIADPSYSGLV